MLVRHGIYMKKNFSKIIKYLLSALLAGILLYFSFREVEWADFVAGLKDCRWEYILLSMAAGADYVKTSTGFSKGGATAEDVALMRKTVGDKLGVKASGGIRDYETAMKMIEAGASRLGCSAGIAIINGASSDAEY